MNYSVLFLCIAGLLLPIQAVQNPVEKAKLDADAMVCEPENTTFIPGEELTYRLYYNMSFIWVAAGEVVFKVEDAGENYKITARGRTYSAYEWFFKANDYFESYVNKSTLKPVSFQREIKENKYRFYEKIEFDRQANTLKNWVGKTADSAKVKVYNADDCVRDVLAIIYAVRVQNFESMPSGSKLPLHVFLDNKAYDLKLKYYGIMEDKRIHGMGKQKAIHLSPELIAGETFNADAKMHIWASADQNKIPLLIESPVSVGSIKAVLVNQKGLKYPFKANQ